MFLALQKTSQTTRNMQKSGYVPFQDVVFDAETWLITFGHRCNGFLGILHSLAGRPLAAHVTLPGYQH
jgi:hypothetical protein